MTRNGIEHPDFQNSKELARRDEETIKKKGIKAPPLGPVRVQKGKAIFFFKTEEQMRNSVIHDKKFKSRYFKAEI